MQLLVQRRPSDWADGSVVTVTYDAIRNITGFDFGEIAVEGEQNSFTRELDFEPNDVSQNLTVMVGDETGMTAATNGDQTITVTPDSGTFTEGDAIIAVYTYETTILRSVTENADPITLTGETAGFTKVIR